MKGLTRRRFLGRSIAALGAFAAACTRRRPRRAAMEPRIFPEEPAVDSGLEHALGIETRWPIKRVIYVMQENRSFDHVLGAFPGADGATTGLLLGEEVPLVRCPQWLPGDLPHNYNASIASINGGRMDNFALPSFENPELAEVATAYAYSQLHESDVPNYWHWAREYVLCDNLFASAPGASYPNHLFFVAGDSGGVFDNPERALTVPFPGGGRWKSWGCDAAEAASVLRREADGTLARGRPCFDLRTVGDQLSDATIPWAYYSAQPFQSAYIWNAYASFPSIRSTDEWTRRIRPVERLLDHIRQGSIPPVTWVTPLYHFSDHPAWSSSHAHNWLTELVNAVMTSAIWSHTAIFITWDEWGGFYDHKPPPEVDALGFGIRVPMLVISPYAMRGYIDHELGEFSSPLKFVQANWHHTERLRRTHDFSHVFDFRQRPRDPDPRPIKADAIGEPWEHPGDDPSWPEEFRPR
jgi:phospholipase C